MYEEPLRNHAQGASLGTFLDPSGASSSSGRRSHGSFLLEALARLPFQKHPKLKHDAVGQRLGCHWQTNP